MITTLTKHKEASWLLVVVLAHRQALTNQSPKPTADRRPMKEKIILAVLPANGSRYDSYLDER